MKFFVKLIISLVLIALILIIVSGILVFNFNKAPEKFIDNTPFSIKKGESISSIAKRLEEEQLINSAFLFKIISKVVKTGNPVKAGNYHIPAGSTTLAIYNLFVSGKEELIKITIPEGWTLKKIANELEKNQIVSETDFSIAGKSPEILEKYNIPGMSCEGYLYPDTYLFTQGLSAVTVIDSMIMNFYKQLEMVVPDYEKMDKQKIFEKIIMASIVEREYRVEDEAPIIASVFYNRLQYRVGLESCATLEYIITDILGKPHPGYITLKDKEIDSLYNTYKWHGLPPGPISNPGKTALHAAFFPAKTDYWFFVLKDKNSGRHYFSKDLEEHISAKFYFLKGYGKTP